MRQTISGTNTDRVEEISVVIETTKGLDATLGIQPPTVTAGTDTDVELTMNFTNTGNVALKAEPVTMDVFNKDTEETVRQEEVLGTVSLGENVTETKDEMVTEIGTLEATIFSKRKSIYYCFAVGRARR